MSRRTSDRVARTPEPSSPASVLGAGDRPR